MVGISFFEPLGPGLRGPRPDWEVPSHLTLLLGMLEPKPAFLSPPRTQAGPLGRYWWLWSLHSGMHMRSPSILYLLFYLHLLCLLPPPPAPERGGSPSWKGRDYSLLPGGGMVSSEPGPTDWGSRGLHGRARASSKRLCQAEAPRMPCGPGPHGSPGRQRAEKSGEAMKIKPRGCVRG